MDGTQVVTTISASRTGGVNFPDGRPARGPVSTLPNELKASILHLRKLHPGWGPDTLLTALKMDPYWADHVLPSRAQLARLLKHAGLTRRYQPHHDLIQPAQASLTDPHQEWQLDAQGVMRVGRGRQSEPDQYCRCHQSPQGRKLSQPRHNQSCFARLSIDVAPGVPEVWSAPKP